MAPLGQGKINEIYDDEVLQYIVDRYHKTVRQVVLRFQIQSGMVVIPKTTHIERMKENLEMFDNEMEILRALDKESPKSRFCFFFGQLATSFNRLDQRASIGII